MSTPASQNSIGYALVDRKGAVFAISLDNKQRIIDHFEIDPTKKRLNTELVLYHAFHTANCLYSSFIKGDCLIIDNLVFAGADNIDHDYKTIFEKYLPPQLKAIITYINGRCDGGSDGLLKLINEYNTQTEQSNIETQTDSPIADVATDNIEQTLPLVDDIEEKPPVYHIREYGELEYILGKIRRLVFQVYIGVERETLIDKLMKLYIEYKDILKYGGLYVDKHNFKTVRAEMHVEDSSDD